MSATETTASSQPRRWRFGNGWATVPMRVFLAALFGFAGYAKLSYPGFFDSTNVAGFKATIDAAKADSPIKGLLGPLSDHPSLFGHVTAYAEFAIGLGLLVGLLTRLAALGGMVLVASIALSVNWGGIKEYTASSGWFTSVDIAVGVALSVYLLGGAGPLSLDGLISGRRARQRARDDAEPAFADGELEASRRRLRGEDTTTYGTGDGEHATRQLPVPEPEKAGRAEHPEPEPNSLWTQGRRDPS
jgi:thiosulfate dehydrogenase [quinone] large subunit